MHRDRPSRPGDAAPMRSAGRSARALPGLLPVTALRGRGGAPWGPQRGGGCGLAAGPRREKGERAGGEASMKLRRSARETVTFFKRHLGKCRLEWQLWLSRVTLQP